MLLMVAVKRYMEAEPYGRKCSVPELKAFKSSLSESDRVQFAGELSVLLGEKVEASAS